MDKTELAGVAEAARNGDRQAFEILYNEYRDKLYFFVKKNVRSEEATEDIVSETFVAAMENISTLKSGEAFGSWLFSIAYHKSMTYLKRSSRYVHFESEEDQENIIGEAGLNEPVELPEDYAVNKQRQEELKRLIEDLKPDQRSAIMLYYYDQMSISEVAESLGISETNAKQKLFTARKKIKQGIEKLYKDGSAFAAVPMASMLDSVMDRKSAAAARAAALPAGGTVSVSGKVIAAAASLTVVAAAGIVFMMSRGGDGQLDGDVRRKIAMVPDSSISEVQSETVTPAPAVTTETSADTDTASKAEDTSSAASAEGTGSSAESTSSSAQTTAATTRAPETTSSSQSDSSSQPEQRVAQPIDMTVDRMLSSSVRELCDLSANDFEYVDFVYGTQVDPVGIKCASFPNYIFVPSTELVDGAPENEFEVPGRGVNSNRKYVIGDQIRMLNLMPGANVEGAATVGMSYTELKAIFANYGSDFKVFTGSDSLGLRAVVNINGRDWYFGFDLTDEQIEEIDNRMQELAGDEVQVGVVNSYDYRVDISDIDPASSVAVLQIR